MCEVKSSSKKIVGIDLGTTNSVVSVLEGVNAKFDTSIDKMVWSSSQYAARFNGSKPFAPDKYVTDYYTDEALKVIENNQNRPFFLYLSHWAIHNPLQALRSDVEQMQHMSGHNLQV